jgi:hypothetical protein
MEAVNDPLNFQAQFLVYATLLGVLLIILGIGLAGLCIALRRHRPRDSG